MPKLTPQEMQELQELEELDRLEKEVGQKAPREPGGLEKLLRGAQSLGSSATGGLVGAQANRMQAAARMGDQDTYAAYARPGVVFETPLGQEGTPEFEQEVAKVRQEQADFEKTHPGQTIAANVAGALHPASVPNQIFKGASKLMGVAARPGVGGFLSNMVRNPAAGALTGAVSQAESNIVEQTQGADPRKLPSVGKAATAGGLIAGGTTMAKGVLDAGKALARSAARMTPGQAKAYTENPAKIRELYEAKYGDNPNPEMIQDMAQSQIQTGMKALKDKGSALKSELRETLAGKNVSLPREQLKPVGIPEVDAELARVQALSPAKASRTMQVPVEGPSPNASSLEELLGAKSAGVQSASVPRQLPNQVGMTASQAQRLKDIAQANTKFLNPQSPLEAQASGAAKGLGVRLQKALEGTTRILDKEGRPLLDKEGKALSQAGELNKVMSKNAQVSSDAALRFRRTPSRALESSSTDIQALVQKLDREGGTNLQSLATALGAAKTMKPSGVVGDTAKILGRGGLRGADSLEKNTSGRDLGRKSLLSILGLMDRED